MKEYFFHIDPVYRRYEIAEKLGVTSKTLLNAIKKYNLKRDYEPRNSGERNGNFKYESFSTNCSQCGKELTLKGYKKYSNINNFCSRKCFIEYSKEHPTNPDNFKDTEKIKNACLKKYGVPYVMHVPEIKEKVRKSLKQSPNIRTYQSKIANHFIDIALSLIDTSQYSRIYCKDNEFFIHDLENKCMYFYDLCLQKPEGTTYLIEFNGTFFHCDPRIYESTFKNPRTKLLASEIWERDARKKLLAEKLNYKYLVIWENDFTKHEAETLKKLMDFLRN